MLANYHIEKSVPTSLVFLPYKFLIGLSNLKKKFHINWLKNTLVLHLKKQVTNVYVYSEGLYKVVSELKSLPPKEASELLLHSERALHKFVKLHESLNSINFFGSKYIRETSEKTLQNFLSIESHIRFLSFSTNNQSVDDTELKEFASALSLNSISMHEYSESNS